MNILVYNYFSESTDNIGNFLDMMDSSVHFAVSFTDCVRILQKNEIDIAIMNPEEFNRNFINTLIKKNSQTKFYLTNSSHIIRYHSNIINVPENSTLFEIGQMINQNRK
ncbi:MAG: hypothetical protein PHR06_08390 [Candidatus Cloacimonetes bacterium]|nr:hypothetical protein [Candidatus Cloacimonadota bacterium]